MLNVSNLLDQVKAKLAGGYPAFDNVDFYCHLSFRGDKTGYDLDIERPEDNELQLTLTEWVVVDEHFSRDDAACVLINDRDSSVLKGGNADVSTLLRVLPRLIKDEDEA